MHLFAANGRGYEAWRIYGVDCPSERTDNRGGNPAAQSTTYTGMLYEPLLGAGFYL